MHYISGDIGVAILKPDRLYPSTTAITFHCQNQKSEIQQSLIVSQPNIAKAIALDSPRLNQLALLTDEELWSAATSQSSVDDNNLMQELLEKQQPQGLTPEELEQVQVLSNHFDHLAGKVSMFDNTCKFLAESFSEDFASWLLGQPILLTQLSPSELSIEPIRADALILLKFDDFALHIEFQTEPDPNIAFRMADYRLRVFRRFPQKQMRQVVIYLTPSGSGRIES